MGVMGGQFVQLIHPTAIQEKLDRMKDQDLYIHLEMTTGAYASHIDANNHPGSAFLTNAVIRYSQGKISGDGPYRIGLKMNQGWVYTEGLTHYDEEEPERLILSGHNREGKLVVALHLSRSPFGQGEVNRT